MSNDDRFLAANAKYVKDFGDKALLPIHPQRKLVVVTCMDSRMDPDAALGIKEGDAHVIRNAGGAAKEALRSIIISQQLVDTHEIAVVHHTHCGMLGTTTPHIQGMLKERYPKANKVAIDAIDFLAFTHLEQSVKDDVSYLKEHELIRRDSVVSGWVYDVKNGKIARII